MSKLSRTISYFKRNGVVPTIYAILERIDKKHMDHFSLLAKAYTGRESISEREKIEQREAVFTKNLKFSIVVPAYETNESYLRAMIESVLSQTYENFELVIADASISQIVRTVVESYSDTRMKYVYLAQNKGISANTNEALKAASGDYIGLLDHDDLLTEDALYEMALYLEQEDAIFVYSDEDKMDGAGMRFFEPNFKPDFNLDYLMTNNYICHFLVMKADVMKQLMVRPDMDGAQDYDLILRAVLYGMRRGEEHFGHVSKILYHWRCHQASTADNPESKRYAYEAGLRALQEFIDALGWKATATHTRHLGFYHVTYAGDIFEQRPDVAAIGGNLYHGNRIVKSPKWKGEPLFNGMHKRYTGYLHRAAMYMDVDALVPECMRQRENLGMTVEEAKQKGMRLLYDPHMSRND